MTFIFSLLRDGAVLLLFSIPLILIARRRNRMAQARGFLIGGAIIAVLSATITVTSIQLVQRCFDAGNSGCQDFGSTGFRMLLMGGYIIVVLVEASLVAGE